MWIILLRWGSTAIAATALAISYLNIEKLAEKFGWDQILVNTVAGVPNLFPSLPWWLWPALFLFFGGAALALWVNHLLSKIQQRITSAPTAGGPNTQQVVLPSPAESWNDEAHLTLVFDKTIKNARAVAQENVPYYYWYPLHEIYVDLDTAKMRTAPCSVIVFLSLKDPTHTSYNRVYVGDGIQCTVLGHNQAGATVWVTGDLGGRTLDIRFSKTPIPVG